MSTSYDNVRAGLLLAAVGAAVYLLYRGVKAVPAMPAASTVAQAVNPANPDNIVNRGVTSIGQAMTGDAGWTLGGWIYDLTHGGGYDPNAPAGSGLKIMPVGVASSTVRGVEQADVRAVDNAIAEWSAAGFYSYDLSGYDYNAGSTATQASVRAVDNELAGDRLASSSFADPNGPAFVRYARP